jgi:hypothetical protein
MHSERSQSKLIHCSAAHYELLLLDADKSDVLPI